MEVIVTTHARMQYVDRCAPALRPLILPGATRQEKDEAAEKIDEAMIAAFKREVAVFPKPEYPPLDGGEHDYQVRMAFGSAPSLTQEAILIVKEDEVTRNKWIVRTVLDPEEYERRKAKYARRQERSKVSNKLELGEALVETKAIEEIYEALSKPWVAVKCNGTREVVGKDSRHEIEKVANRWLAQGCDPRDFWIKRSHDHSVRTIVDLG